MMLNPVRMNIRKSCNVGSETMQMEAGFRFNFQPTNYLVSVFMVSVFLTKSRF